MMKKNQWKLQKKLETSFSENPVPQRARDNFFDPLNLNFFVKVKIASQRLFPIISNNYPKFNPAPLFYRQTNLNFLYFCDIKLILSKKGDPMIQRHLFEPTLIKSASLIASDSPRQAFYNIRLFAYKNIYTVRKESGAKGKTWDVRLWKFDSFEKAEKDFERRIKQKT